MKGQIWSTDFALSLLIFTIAAAIAFTILTNALQQDSYDDVRKEAATAAELLSNTGYPTHWTNASLIRAGLVSNNHLSLRKMQEFSSTNPVALRQSLRVTDDFYIYLTNQSNDTVSMYGACGVGTMSFPGTLRNGTLHAAAFVSGAHPVSDQVNATQYTGDSFFTNLSKQDVIILEGNLPIAMSRSQAALHFRDAAREGVTFVVVGDPGIPVLGINVNASAITSALVAVPAMGFSVGENLSFNDTYATLDPSTDPAVTGYTPLIEENGKAIYATWIYDDARVWYFATSNGTSDAGSLVLRLGNATHDLVTFPQPDCPPFTPPSAKQVAVYTRTVPYHDHLLTMNVLVWRTR